MDRMIYTAMTGASHTMLQQASVAQNLSNISTPGYRSAINTFRAVPLVGEGLPTREFVVDSSVGTDFTPGVLQQTARDLDVAIIGEGWLAVQGPDGREAYTRNGSLQLTPEGVLQTRTGLTVMGDGGAITIPQDTQISIARDGTISTVPTGTQPNQVVMLGNIKLVNPPENQLVRGDDGLFRMRDGTIAVPDANVQVEQGSIESSNVNSVAAMVDMITLARQYDMQMKTIQTAGDNARQAASLLSLNG